MTLSNHPPPPGLSTPRRRPHEHARRNERRNTYTRTSTPREGSTFLAAEYSRPRLSTANSNQSLPSYVSVRKLGDPWAVAAELAMLSVHVGIPAAVPPPRVELPRREHRYPPQQERIGGLHLLPPLPADGARPSGGASPLLRERDLLELSRAPRPAPWRRSWPTTGSRNNRRFRERRRAERLRPKRRSRRRRARWKRKE